jgi:transcriptional regulator with XRE-family HTH domain
MAIKRQPRALKPVGQVIRDARLAAGLSLRDIERLTGIAASQTSRIELGRSSDPGFTTVARLASALGLPLDKLALALGLAPHGVPVAKGGMAYETRTVLGAAAALEEARRHAERAIAAIDEGLNLVPTARASVPKRRR